MVSGRKPILGGLGALATAAVLLMPAAPAMAKKKQADSVDLSMSESFRATALRARTALSANDIATANREIAGLVPTSGLEKYAAAGLRMELASRRNDPQTQRKALTDMLESGAAPAAEVPYLRYLAGYYSYFLGEHGDAIAQVSYARQLGYAPVSSTVLLADANIKKGRTAEGMKLIEQAIAEQRALGKAVPEPWFDRAVAISTQLNNWPDVAKWYQQKLAAYPSQGNWRTSLSNYLSAPGIDSQVQLDLYRLQAATGAMASERDFQAYSTLAARSGFDAEAKAVIETGRASGKLTPTDSVTAGLLKTATPKATKAIAELPAQVAKAKSAANGNAAMAAGDSYFSLAQYPKAVEQYRLALSKGGVDDARVNSRLGVALARSGDLAGAKAALAQANGNWANVARFWTVWVDQQAQIQQATNAAPAAASTLNYEPLS